MAEENKVPQRVPGIHRFTDNKSPCYGCVYDAESASFCAPYTKICGKTKTILVEDYEAYLTLRTRLRLGAGQDD